MVSGGVLLGMVFFFKKKVARGPFSCQLTNWAVSRGL